MKPLPPLLLGLALAFPLAAPAQRVEFPAASPAATLRQRVGLTDIEVRYCRPSSKGRTMLGGIVPYGEVWRTGANAATTLSFSAPVRMNGAEIPAGTYALFTIPGKTEWTIIINKTAKQWGAFHYDAKQDLVRFRATPVPLAARRETFTIEFDDLRDGSATFELEWEHTRVPIRLEVGTTAMVLRRIQAALAEPGPKRADFDYSAAMFYFDHGQNLGECLRLVNAMLAQHPPTAFEGLYLKARILAKQGDRAGAIAAAKASRRDAKHFEGGNASAELEADALITSLGG